VHARRVDPHPVGDGGIIRRDKMRQHQRLDAGRLRDTPGIFSGRMARQEMPLERRRIGNPGVTGSCPPRYEGERSNAAVLRGR
jgi:hypothetical protein